MKKTFALPLALALTLALSFAGCGMIPGPPPGVSTAPPVVSAAPAYSSAAQPEVSAAPADSSAQPPDTSAEPPGISAAPSDTAAPTSDVPTQVSENTGGESSAGVTLEAGREFGSFYWAFSNAESDFVKLIRQYGDDTYKDVYEHYNFVMASDGVDRCTWYLDDLGAFDGVVSQGDSATDGAQTVNIFGSELAGGKQTNGGVITATIEDTLSGDARWREAGAEPGDRARLKAALDTKNLTLSYESTLERDGATVDRTVMEAAVLPDGTMLFQFLHVENLYSDDQYAEEYAVFKRISGGSYSCIVAHVGLDFNFTYNSILGRGDMTADKMATGNTSAGTAHLFTVDGRYTEGDKVYGMVGHKKYISQGAPRKNQPDVEEPVGENTPAAGVRLNPGSEFADFSNAFGNAETPFSNLFYNYAESITDTQSSFDFMMAYNDVINTGFWYESFFDMQDGTHTLDWPALEAARQTSGDVVTVLVDDTLKDDYANAKKGDHMRLKATLDTKNLTLGCERVLKRGGEYLERAVTEAVILPDGTMLLQRFIKGTDPVYGERLAIFMRISGGSYSALVAEIGTDYGYTYDSILGKGDMTAGEMARGCALTHEFTVENGKVSYTRIQ